VNDNEESLIMAPDTDTDRGSEIPEDARTSRPGLPGNQAVLEELLREARRECEGLRAALAAETEAARRDRAAARASVDRAQDLDAALFRLRDQLKLARMDADESYTRVLDLEQQLQALCEHRDTVLQDLVQARNHLGQALALHEHEATRWRAELDGAHRAHEQDTARWRAELDEAHRAHEQDTARSRAEMERLRVQADETARLLVDLLSSRSWRWTRLLRQIVAGVRGRSWVEPQAPTVDDPAAVVRPRDADGKSND
jgi:chromosome segregation ATPase